MMNLKKVVVHRAIHKTSFDANPKAAASVFGVLKEIFADLSSFIVGSST